MSVIRIKKHTEDYAVIHKACLEDERLSYRARGLLAYLLAKPNDWRIHIASLARHAKEGRTAVTTAMNELLECGYAKRILVRNQDGTLGGWETHIYEVPQETIAATESLPTPATTYPDTEQPKSGFPHSVESHSVESHSDNLIYTKYPETKYPNTKYPEEYILSETAKSEKKPKEFSPESKSVLAYLNSITGRGYRTIGEIQKCLNRGASVQDCILVLNYLHTVRRKSQPEWVSQYLDHTTPFRADNFDKYFALAREWRDTQNSQNSHTRNAVSQTSMDAILAQATRNIMVSVPTQRTTRQHSLYHTAHMPDADQESESDTDDDSFI